MKKDHLQQKGILVWILVIGSMVVILILWFFYFKNYLDFMKSDTVTSAGQTGGTADFQKLLDQLSANIDDFKSKIETNLEDQQKLNQVNQQVAAALLADVSWSRHQDQKLGLAIDFPDDWAVRTDENQIGFYPQSIADKLSPNINEDLVNIKITPDIKEETLTGWFNNNFSNIEKTDLEIDGWPAIQLVASLGNQSVINTYLLVKNSLYNVTFLEYKTVDEQAKNIYTKMITSIQFLKP
ncbi:MAG TPA: hypothetical protein VGA49_02610 [Patescibacteria group bacterium]